MSSESVFRSDGVRAVLDTLKAEVRELYLSDKIPWVVGYSGGKDSSATLQLVWLALQDMAPEERTKTVHVISTDTLVENPVVSAWVEHSLDKMDEAAQEQGLPIESHQLLPDLHDTFWVNLIGRGYPAPRPKFRWCTERLKINPSNEFISRVVRENGEAILVLGTRKAESTKRAARMEELEKERVRSKLSPNKSLPNSLVYSPIEDWTDDDVWLFLMQVGNCWGIDHKDLLNMYQGASADGECPLVVDTTTPSCGDSRFGCWVCTMVEQDKSMSAMIQNDQEKEWMLPLLQLRNELDVGDDKDRRDFRRMNGNVQVFGEGKWPIHGPYTQEWRETWLRKVLQAQNAVRRLAPDHVKNIKLIRIEELEEIRRIWVVEKHEMEDTLPDIYEDETDEPYPGDELNRSSSFGAEEMRLLREIADSEIQFELIRELLDVEQQHRTMVRRAGLFDALEKALRRGFYDSKEDAVERARERQQKIEDYREQGSSSRDEPTPAAE
jgi:DNA sulfur modification protein DndC